MPSYTSSWPHSCLSYNRATLPRSRYNPHDFPDSKQSPSCNSQSPGLPGWFWSRPMSVPDRLVHNLVQRKYIAARPPWLKHSPSLHYTDNPSCISRDNRLGVNRDSIHTFKACHSMFILMVIYGHITKLPVNIDKIRI